ncbi:hypothetical protein HK098_003589 [Nowakowskiella sp. JEL0407]|nr:hypothetical protein HK098_003589 [Nowakowskiella sp. JEL0407]
MCPRKKTCAQTDCKPGYKCVMKGECPCSSVPVCVPIAPSPSVSAKPSPKTTTKSSPIASPTGIQVCPLCVPQCNLKCPEGAVCGYGGPCKCTAPLVCVPLPKPTEIAESSRWTGVEDLRRNGTTKSRKRTNRHRAQKRNRTYKKSNIIGEEFPPLSTIVKDSIISLDIPTYKEILSIPKPAAIMPVQSQISSEVRTTTAEVKPLKSKSPKSQIRKASPKTRRTVPVSPKSLDVRTSLPIVDVHRDRRRRLSSIKKHMTASPETVSKPQLTKEVSIAKKSKLFDLTPTWLRFGFVWDCAKSLSLTIPRL